MMSNKKTFIATGVRRYEDVRKPAVTVYADPLNAGKFIACFTATDCDEMIDGYSYDELLSIRNAINEALTDIDVRESVAELNKKDPRYHSFND